jgi:hypothetical protein
MKKPHRLSTWVIFGVLKEIKDCLTCYKALGPSLVLTLATSICLPGSLFGAYTPYYSDTLYMSIDSTKWFQNGVAVPF